MPRKKKNRTAVGEKKRPYKTPRLTAYGNLQTNTLVKRGARTDGSGKPSTRASGSNA